MYQCLAETTEKLLVNASREIKSYLLSMCQTAKRVKFVKVMYLQQTILASTIFVPIVGEYFTLLVVEDLRL